MTWGIRIRGPKTGSTLVLPEFQVVIQGVNVAQTATPFANTEYNTSSLSASKAFDGDTATYWQAAGSAPSECYIGVFGIAVEPSSAIARLYGFGYYSGQNLDFTNSTLEISNNTTTGHDGGWVVVAENVSVLGGQWLEIPLLFSAPLSPLSRPPLPAILTALPASLARGFQ